MPERFLTIGEIAAELRVSRMTIYRLVHNGTLPSIRIGHSFRVSQKDFDHYLENEART